MDMHTTETSQKPFTVIDGGKSQTPGEVHMPSQNLTGYMAITDKCKKGILFAFDLDERCKDCPGIGVIDSSDILVEILMMVLEVAATAQRIARDR